MGWRVQGWFLELNISTWVPWPCPYKKSLGLSRFENHAKTILTSEKQHALWEYPKKGRVDDLQRCQRTGWHIYRGWGESLCLETIIFSKNLIDGTRNWSQDIQRICGFSDLSCWYSFHINIFNSRDNGSHLSRQASKMHPIAPPGAHLIPGTPTHIPPSSGKFRS